MKKFFNSVFTNLRALDRNERAWILGLIFVLIGLSYLESVFYALVVVGAMMAGESVLTSYFAIYFGTKGDR